MREQARKVARQFQFESASNPGLYYSVLVWDDGELSCNCKGWIYSLRRSTDGRRFCKHTTQIDKALAENLARPKINKWVWVASPVRESARTALTDAGQKDDVPVTLVTRQKRMFDLD